MTSLPRRSLVVIVGCALALSFVMVSGAAGGTAGAGAGAAGPATGIEATVTVNPAQHYQVMAGFGASEGFGEAKALMKAPASVQLRVLSLLYSPTQGAGLTVLRNEVSADAGFTIEPKAPSGPAGKPSYLTLAEIGQDQGQLWLAKRIKADYGVSDVFADAWSAPGFMKTNGSAIDGGSVCGAPGASCRSGDWRQAYANYLVQYAKDYAAAGVPLRYLGPENEATFAPPRDSMIMTPGQTANLMGVLGAALARSGLSTRAECCASVGWNDAQQYATAIERDKAAAAATALFTSHGYFVAPSSPLKGWGKPVWETEWAPFGFGAWDPSWDDGSGSSGFTWAQNIYTGLTGANLGAFLYLWGASMTSLTGPNTGLVGVKGQTVAPSGRLWAFAGYSRFVRPGAVRIGATTSAAGLEVCAFANTDGSMAVIALNRSLRSRAATFSVRRAPGAKVTPFLVDASHQLSPQAPISASGNVFKATMPPRSLVTHVIRS